MAHAFRQACTGIYIWGLQREKNISKKTHIIKQASSLNRS